jgi:hypothetical protein
MKRRASGLVLLPGFFFLKGQSSGYHQPDLQKPTEGEAAEAKAKQDKLQSNDLCEASQRECVMRQGNYVITPTPCRVQQGLCTEPPEPRSNRFAFYFLFSS